MNIHLMFLLCTIGILGYLTDNANANCTSFDGDYVLDGETFSPQGKDECTTCLCGEYGKALHCNTLDCGPPVNLGCLIFEKVKGCCQFKCSEPFKIDNQTESNKFSFFKDNRRSDMDYPTN